MKKTTLEQIREALEDMSPEERADVRAYIDRMIARRTAGAGRDHPIAKKTAGKGRKVTKNKRGK